MTAQCKTHASEHDDVNLHWLRRGQQRRRQVTGTTATVAYKWTNGCTTRSLAQIKTSGPARLITRVPVDTLFWLRFIHHFIGSAADGRETMPEQLWWCLRLSSFIEIHWPSTINLNLYTKTRNCSHVCALEWLDVIVIPGKLSFWREQSWWAAGWGSVAAGNRYKLVWCFTRLLKV